MFSSCKLLTISNAVNESFLFILISSLESCLYEKPRAALSSCGEDTPRSNIIASTVQTPFTCKKPAISLKLPCIKVTRSLKSDRKFLASFIASSSQSIAINRPVLSLFTISNACPARPSVPSTYIPSGFILRPSMLSFSSTGICSIDNHYFRFTPGTKKP
jgi:hypothetical protein